MYLQIQHVRVCTETIDAVQTGARMGNSTGRDANRIHVISVANCPSDDFSTIRRVCHNYTTPGMGSELADAKPQGKYAYT